jgi:hypothetical protein
MAVGKNQAKIEYGDFQTPVDLAVQVCDLLSQLGCEPRAVLEPTCGVGHFLSAALQSFPSLTHLAGVEINPAYVKAAKVGVATYTAQRPDVVVDIGVADFFVKEWKTYLAKLPDPILIVGNPPWVTNAGIGAIDGNNLPQKHNSQNLPGLAALTGASNFDISEWMLLQILEWIEDRSGMVAMLCKTSVARKVLLSIWKKHNTAAHSRFYTIDSQKMFGVSVDACLLVYDNRANTTNQTGDERSCYVYDTLAAAKPSAHIGYREGALVSDVDLFDRWRHLLATPKVGQRYAWRSGIKHDASSVMELTKDECGYTNRLDETASLEDDYLYPMLKSSDIARKLTRTPRFWMLVTQRQIGEETASIRLTAPKTWQYLKSHTSILDGRKSSIYRNRPPYSIFGVGEYSFSPWKVAISGMYKDMRFQVIGEYNERPVVLDDTCYFLSCASQAEAEFIAGLLNSEIAQEFYRAFIFWDEKRPITVRLLRKLDIAALADELGVGDQLAGFDPEMEQSHSQLRLLENTTNYRA